MSSPFVKCEDSELKEQWHDIFERSMKFIAVRQRTWEVVLFRCEGDEETAPIKFFSECQSLLWDNKALVNDTPCFKGVVSLYSSTPAKSKNCCNRIQYPTLHDWLKNEHQQDSRLHQLILQQLPLEQKKVYYREKAADPDYVSGDRIARRMARAREEGRPFYESMRTSDVFGKELSQMRQTPDLGRESTPLIFHLLAGYFLKPRGD